MHPQHPERGLYFLKAERAGFSVIPIEDISGLDFAELDGMKLDELLSRARITGAEPINYPLTDGVILYIQDPQKRRAALLIEQDPEEDRFSVKIARLP